MKKLLSLLMVAGIFSLVACGPSEEEIQARIDQSVESALNEATSTTVLSETTTTVEVTTTVVQQDPIEEASYSESYNKDFYFFI